MQNKEHYERTKEFHKISATEKNGYYNAMLGSSLKYSIWQKRIFKMALNLLDELLRDNSSINNAIDAGCGRGDFTIKVASRYEQLKKVTGCDFVEEALSIARNDSKSIDNISFLEAGMLNMPFDDNYSDLTYCINVLHHIHKSDFKKALSELARISNKYLVLEIKNSNSLLFDYMFKRSFCSMTVYPTTINEVSNILADYNFQLKKHHSIFLFDCVSPLVVLLYEKMKRNDQ